MQILRQWSWQVCNHINGLCCVLVIGQGFIQQVQVIFCQLLVHLCFIEYILICGLYCSGYKQAHLLPYFNTLCWNVAARLQHGFTLMTLTCVLWSTNYISSWCLLDHCDNQLITLSSKIFRLLQFSSLLMVPKQWKIMVQYVWSVRLVVVAELHIMYAWSVNWQMVFLVYN